MTGWVCCSASPSLALLKYWGKLPGGENLPATPSLAVTLGGLSTKTWVRPGPGGVDSVAIAGEKQEPARYSRFFDGVRAALGVAAGFEARSANSFPTAAGLASSSSGFAALAGACVRAEGRELPAADVSALARIGSVSAARSVFGGFVLLPAGGRSAVQVHDPGHWPELRVIVAVTQQGKKPVSSRDGMARTTSTSPFFPQWVEKSKALLPEALAALKEKDLEKLGDVARASFSMMHATALAAQPPLLYWIPATVAVMDACRELREKGIGAWETIDAGPQVKI
ncbi:MAG TPA: diphosphomevalonate decarboxylase, partial [bacterium]|nr:diphosphomevalonate decarboxylase [bacterium]